MCGTIYEVKNNKEMKIKRLSPYKNIVLVYIGIIVLGAILLATPWSNKSGQWTSIIDSLFTATSAMAVTGLVVVDTATYWSLFGQIVILLLIQVGGMGIMTLVSLLHVFVTKKMSQRESNVIMASAGVLTRQDVRKIMNRVIIITAVCEAIGAVILTLAFLGDNTFGQALYKGIFHSVSAFCNAGFDIMGTVDSMFVSFTSYSTNWLVCLTLMFLITFGGTGFLVWNDIIEHKWHFKKYKLHCRIVLIANSILVFGGALLFGLFEFNNSATMGGSSFGDIVLMSLFQSVTCRTAGFNSIDIGSLTEASKGLSMMLMMIGGGAGSTAGGIKITTAVVLLVGILAVARNKKDVTILNKRIDDSLVRNAITIFSMWMIITLVSTIIICVADSVTFTEALFECYSALGTVGLSLGITTTLGTISKSVLIVLMFVGRVGITTILMAVLIKRKEDNIRKPVESILIG